MKKNILYCYKTLITGLYNPTHFLVEIPMGIQMDLHLVGFARCGLRAERLVVKPKAKAFRDALPRW